MSNPPIASEEPETRSRLRFAWLSGLKDNPIVVKELRSRMRGSRAMVLLTLYLLLLGGLVSLALMPFLLNDRGYFDLYERQNLGKTVFGTAVLVQLFAISFIAPGLTAGAIASERERQTFEILRTTMLSARKIVTGKLTSALAFIGLLLLTAIPIESLGFLFGGVTLTEILIASVMLIVTALIFSAIGIFFSSLMKSVLSATVFSYAASILVVSGLPILILFFTILLEPLFGYSFAPNLGDVQVFLLGALLWLIVSINPIAAGIGTEAILIDEGSAWSIQASLPNSGVDIPVPSPWLGYVVVHVILSLILTMISIYLVRKPRD